MNRSTAIIGAAFFTIALAKSSFAAKDKDKEDRKPSATITKTDGTTAAMCDTTVDSTKDDPKVRGGASTSSVLGQKAEARVKRAEHLAEKGANTEFLNSPQGIAFKKQLSDTDDEINAVYEKYLNVFRVNPATEEGKKLRKEMDNQLQLLNQKRDKIEADYENLKKKSAVYQDMLEKHTKSEMAQVKWKTKSQ